MGILAFSLASCGNERVAEQEPTVDLNIDLEGTSISVAVIYDTGISGIAEMFMTENPGTTIEIINYDGDWERAFTQLAAEIMSGEAPTVMTSSLVDYTDPNISRLMADWFTIMRSDPDFREEDYFMNVINAAAVNGRLVGFPMSYDYQLVAFNNAVPGYRQLAERDTITAVELLEFHAESDANIPYVDSNFDLSVISHSLIPSFFDYQTGQIDFENQRFIDILNHSLAATEPEKSFGMTMSGGLFDPNTQAERAAKYFYNINGPYDLSVFMEFENALFEGSVPLVNSRGELMANVWDSYLLNASATHEQQVLAWNFVKFLLRVPAEDEPQRYVSSTPITPALLRYSLETTVTGLIDVCETHYGSRLVGTEEEILEYTYNRMIEIANMPMTDYRYAPNSITAIPWEVLTEFHEGLITAEQAAAQMQNRMSLAIMEMN
ncbi:MAG: hypothetical protein LBI27_07290 [Clostridiales bacterium]|jgi:ABC-type glycerol-3-phosphate transport system substrate-binding protein|nr:hypothetical protein [Clostridiales bacterium]